MIEEGSLWLDAMLSGTIEANASFRPTVALAPTEDEIRIHGDRGSPRVYSREQVLRHLRRSVDGFTAPFPLKPAELEDHEQMFHVEQIDDCSLIVVLVHPPQVATLSIMPREDETDPGGAEASDGSRYFTLSLPSICWFLLIDGNPGEFAIDSVTAFFVGSTALEFSTPLCLPALLNVNTHRYSICAPFEENYWDVYDTLARVIQQVERAVLFSKWNWDMEEQGGTSALTEFRERSTDRRLASFAAWQEATLKGEAIWSEPGNFIPVTTVAQHLHQQLGFSHKYTDSLPYRIGAALAEMARVVEPRTATRSAR
ncbi:MAG: hypothetical protein HY815_32240 [Candidatus Riflebacteria bacterium]|nr:hypothetical protein [Candidatus Riflebacteria bacterium]